MNSVEHAVIITNNEHKINLFLAQGWLVKSVTRQSVSGSDILLGQFLIVFERPINKAKQ